MKAGISILILLAFVALEFDSAYSQASFWTPFALPDKYTSYLAYNSKGVLYAATFQSGIYRTDDGGRTWKYIFDGWGWPFFTSITLGTDNDLYVGSEVGIFLSNDGGSTWGYVFIDPVKPGATDICIHRNGSVFAGSYIGVLRSTDRGQTWYLLNRGLPSVTVGSMACDSSGNVFAGLDGGGIYRSSDMGETWQEVSGTLRLKSQRYVRTIQVNSKNVVFAGTIGGMLRSDDHGNTWHETNPEYDFIFMDVLLIDRKDNLVVGTAGQGAYYSNDGGETWNEARAGLISPYVLSLAQSPQGIILGGSNGGGVYHLVRGSEFYEPPTPEVPSQGAVNQSTSTRFAWSECNSASSYRLQVSEDTLFTGPIMVDTTISKPFFLFDRLSASRTYYWRVKSVNQFWTSVPSRTHSFTTAGNFELVQNYPNPFNAGTTIRYTLPRESDVSLKIFNTLGQLVATLVDGKQEAGDHQVQWNASVASGLYFYRLQAGDFVKTNKMLLLK